MKRTVHTVLVGALLATSLSATAQGIKAYATDSEGRVVHNPFGECWRTGSWTKEGANSECDPRLFPQDQAATQTPATEPAAQPVAMAAPQPAPAPAPVAIPQPEAVQALGAAVRFAFDDATLRDADRAELDALAARLQMDKVGKIRVTGHTCAMGTPEYNMGLSLRRAESVKAYLVGKGIDGGLISTQGMGLTQPIASNENIEGRTRNRRAEIDITAR